MESRDFPCKAPWISGLHPFTTLQKCSDAFSAGVTMVFTGEMDQITRHEAEEKAKAAGAKVPGNADRYGQIWTDMDRYGKVSPEILER